MGKAQSDIAVKRHAVNFMYDAPPGMVEKKEGDGKLELDPERQLRLDEKFKALKGAPREAYAKDLPARDNPLGIQIRNVQCRKCEEWGHQSTDRECPLFGVAKLGEDGEAERQGFEDPAVLMKQMAQDGFAIKQTALGRRNDIAAENQQILIDPPDQDREAAFLASLSSSEKRRLHKKLAKLEDDPEAAGDAIAAFAADIATKSKKSKKSKHKKEKKDRKSKKKKHKKHKAASRSDGDSRSRRGRDQSGSSDSSDDDDDGDVADDRDRGLGSWRERSPVRSSAASNDRSEYRDVPDDRDGQRNEHGDRPRGGYADPDEGETKPAQPRMSLQLSAAAYKLTGRTKPPPPPPTAAEAAAAEKTAPRQCFRCGRDGHTRNFCKEYYHKSGSRLMKGHFA